MKTLVFDTCFNKTYLVLKSDENILASEIIDSTDTNYHSAYLIPKIKDVLKAKSLLVRDLDAIGVNIGPGSFTGIRAGITIARVLSQQAGLKLVGVTSLEILSKLNMSDKKTIVVTDARKNKVYFAEYKNSDVITEPTLVEKDESIEKLSSDDFVISDSSISEFLLEHSIKSLNYENCSDNLGEFLSDIVSHKLKTQNEDFNWAKVKPLYIQKPSITKPKELKNV
ncbi:MAG: tRNA (adenosine(37)-N6)-threonylcarbamoyltransferase complex dimerization subunit type 1 TsaB [Candidatus Gastranaerophilales bacterium]|nr:tRNA (adenosine(37)-N6)-threonylcarbamoyltransferase complex dimerization subunit type 1 TsaB [Candidatus Gastranaerophilales bacterium]